MRASGRCCIAALVLLALTCDLVNCSRLSNVLAEEISPCFHDCSIKEGFCENGGTCVKLDSICSATSFSCLCPSGFTGTRCNKYDELCKYEQLFTDVNCYCENGATCLKIGEECAPSSYKCACTAGFEGLLCESPLPVEVSEFNSTVQSTQSTTSTNDPTTSHSMTAEAFSVRNSLGSSLNSTSDLSNGSSTAQKTEITTWISTEIPVINVTIYTTEVQPSTKPHTTSPTPQPPKQLTPGLQFIQDGLKPMKLYLKVDPQLCSKCVHGQCVENETEDRCKCNPGYYGQYCDSQCSKGCLNGGICTYSKGLESCRCDAMYEGEFCQEKRAVPIDIPTSLVTRETVQQHNEMEKNIYQELYGKRFCAANFECIHGVCNSSDHRHPKCLCEEGYIGDFCHIKCAKKCLNQGRCLVVNATEKCNCPKRYRGELCEKDSGYFLKQLSTGAPVKAANRKRPVSPNQHHAKQPSQLKALSSLMLMKPRYLFSKTERRDPTRCPSNFNCIHGRCVTSGYTRCICDPGYNGQFCQHKCSLKCANSGVCIHHNGQQVCNCKNGFQGKLCEYGIYYDNSKGKVSANRTSGAIATRTTPTVSLATSAPS